MITDEELEVALAGLGFSAVAATTSREVTSKDLRTDLRNALEKFLEYITVGISDVR